MTIKNEFRVLLGTSKDVEEELNSLNVEWEVFLHRFSAASELTSALVEITKRDDDSAQTETASDLIDSIEKNAVDNKSTISDVKLWCRSWRKELGITKD